MPTIEELELLKLVEAERRRNSAPIQASVQRPLPDLPPGVLMSPSAQREMAAAQMLAGQAYVPPPRTRPQRELAPRPSTRQVTASQAAQGSEESLLAGLFMGREAQEAATVLGTANYQASSFETEAYDISYDGDFVEGRGVPNEAVRFQVGRDTPRSSGFTPSMASGPSDGMVVSRRGENGSWRSESRTMSRAEAVARSTPPPVVRTQAPPTRTPAPAPAVPRVTIYDHLRNS